MITTMYTCTCTCVHVILTNVYTVELSIVRLVTTYGPFDCVLYREVVSYTV